MGAELFCLTVKMLSELNGLKHNPRIVPSNLNVLPFQIIDFLISAYRFGSFDKVIEFINLRRRLSSSQQFASLNVEQVLLKLIWETSDHAQAVDLLAAHQIDPEKDDISWSDLTDNRDFKVMTSWDPTDK